MGEPQLVKHVRVADHSSHGPVAWLSRGADVCRRDCNQRIGSVDEQCFEDGKVIRSVRDETLTPRGQPLA
jgi:hypothetical protein